MSTSLERNLTLSLDLDPALLSQVVDPEIVKLLRIVILATKDVHVAIVDGGRVTAAGARYRLSWRNLNVLPLICCEVVDRGLICTVALLEASEDDHLRSLLINNTCVLVPQHDLVTTRSYH